MLWELIKWSPDVKSFHLQTNSLNKFFKEMYVDLSAEFVCGYDGDLISVYSCRGIGLWDFTMAPAELVRKLEKGGLTRFTASISAGGVPVHVEILAGMRFGRPQFAVGFSFDSESYGKLAEKLSGIGVDFLDKLGFELQVTLICKNALIWRKHNQSMRERYWLGKGVNVFLIKTLTKVISS